MNYSGNGTLAIVADDPIRPPHPATLSTSLPPRKSDSRKEDIDLVRRCREGDLSAFEVIYRRHSTSLYNLILRMVGNLADAEDLLQEIFLLAFNKLSSYKGQAALSTWFYRVAVNRCLDYIRSRAARNQSVTDSLDEKEGIFPAAAGESISERMDLEKAIGQLPHSTRAAFLLFDVEGFEHREVADILGVAEGTSKSLVHRARHRIRDFYKPSRPGEGQ